MGKYLAVTYDSERVYIALVKNGAVAGAAAAPILSAKNSGEAISIAVREAAIRNGLKNPEAAMCVPDRDCLTKRIDGTNMTEGDLLMNLPYEFGEYIRQGLESDYKYDYQVLNADKEERRLLAVAVLRTVIGEAVELAEDAGMTLSRLVPETCALGDLVERFEHGHSCAIVTVDAEDTMIRLFSGPECYASHEINFGVAAIREELQARNYSFFDNGNAVAVKEILNSETVRTEATTLALNILSALDYFREENLFDTTMPIYLAGEGSLVPELVRQLAEGTGSRCENVSKLMKGTIEENLAAVLASAIGAAIDR